MGWQTIAGLNARQWLDLRAQYAGYGEDHEIAVSGMRVSRQQCAVNAQLLSMPTDVYWWAAAGSLHGSQVGVATEYTERQCYEQVATPEGLG